MRHFRLALVGLGLVLAATLACGQGAAPDTLSMAAPPTMRPTFTPTLPPTDTPTPTPTPTVTPTPTPTDTPTPLPTETPTLTPTLTLEPPTATPAATHKPSAPTKTPVPPTATPVPWLLKDSFDAGLGGAWRPFLNYWRLAGDQWYWTGGEGVGGSGALVHNCCINGGEAEDALMMYLGDGAEGWTDYRVSVDIMVPTEKGQWQGLWVRGQFEERNRKDAGQWVTGYYVLLGRNRAVKLLQLQTGEDCREAACQHPENQYAFHNPYIVREVQVEGISLTRYAWHTLAVEVRGNRLQIWVDGVYAFDHVDDQAPFLTGTIGFKTFESEPALFDNLVVTPLQ